MTSIDNISIIKVKLMRKIQLKTQCIGDIENEQNSLNSKIVFIVLFI